MTPGSLSLPAGFLADLAAVCPVDDIESDAADASPAAVPSDDDLTTLGDSLFAWRAHHQSLLRGLLARLSDDDPLLNPVSLFGTMDLGRLETAHTRTLAWLLGDREHGFGTQLLEALLRHLTGGLPVHVTQLNFAEGEYPVQFGPGDAGTGRIDVFATGRWQESGVERAWRLVIEAKVDAEEGVEQLTGYDHWLGHASEDVETIRVFLSPEGRAPATGSGGWAALSYPELAGLLRRASSSLRDRPGYHFLRYYLTGVLRDVCRLPVPVRMNDENPYAAVEYLRSVLE